MANNNIRKSVGCDSGITGGNTYNARYQYTLDLDGGNFVLDTPEIDGTVSGAYPAGQTIYIPSVKPVKEGYTFKQWCRTDTNTEVTDEFSMPDHDTTVIAIWEPNAVYAYTLDLAGGTFGIPGSGLQIQGSPFGTPNGNYEEGTEIVLPLFDPVKQGFVFVEWLRSDTGLAVTDGFSMPANDVTVTAVYKGIYQYTLDLDGGHLPPASSQGGADGTPSGSYVEGETIWMPSYIPEKLGYNFVKWVRLDMDTEVIISMVMPANDVTVKAVWESNPYQYVLDFDGGSLPNPPSGTIGTPNGMYLPGTVITLPVDIPVRMDYDFNGWQRNDTNVIVAGSFVMPANDVIVKASWTYAPYYNYTIDLGGGSGVTGGTPGGKYKAGDTITLPNGTPTKQGCVFMYWQRSDTATQVTGSFVMPSHDVTVTAVFDCSTYSVSFNGNGGNNIPGTVSNVSMGSTFNIPTVIPTKDSSTFLGWKDKNGSPVFSGYKNPGDTFTMPQRNVTLDASWATIYWKSTAINAIVPLINSDTLEILGTNNLAGTVYSNLDGGGKGWTAVSNNSWITITNNGSGTMDNNGNIAADIWSCDIKLDPNTTTSSRTGSVTFTQKDSGLVFVQSFEQEGQNNQVFVVFQSKDPGSMYDGFAIHSVTVPLNDPGSTPSILPGASYKATVDSSVITSSTFGFGRMWEVAVGGQNENVHVWMGYYIGGAAYIPAVQTQTLTQIEVIPPTGYGFIYTLTMQNVMAEIEYNGVVKAVSFSYSTNGQSLIFTFDPIVIDSSLNKSVMIRLSKNGTGHFGFYKI